MCQLMVNLTSVTMQLQCHTHTLISVCARVPNKDSAGPVPAELADINRGADGGTRGGGYQGHQGPQYMRGGRGMGRGGPLPCLGSSFVRDQNGPPNPQNFFNNNNNNNNNNNGHPQALRGPFPPISMGGGPLRGGGPSSLMGMGPRNMGGGPPRMGGGGGPGPLSLPPHMRGGGMHGPPHNMMRGGPSSRPPHHMGLQPPINMTAGPPQEWHGQQQQQQQPLPNNFPLQQQHGGPSNNNSNNFQQQQLQQQHMHQHQQFQQRMMQPPPLQQRSSAEQFLQSQKSVLSAASQAVQGAAAQQG